MAGYAGMRADLESRLRFRASEYAALSNVFAREIAPGAIRDAIDAARSALASIEASEADGASVALAQAMAALDDVPFEDLCVKTRTEYVRMFVGLRSIVVPAHESMYRGDSRRMMTSVTFAVRHAYSASGFEVIKKNSEPDDHIGIELEFVSVLCARCADEVAKGRLTAAQQDLAALDSFLGEHVRLWAPEFADLTIRADQSGFYGPWARYLKSYLVQDAECGAACANALRGLVRRHCEPGG